MTDLTLYKFLEIAQVYPYSQEYYESQQDLMEMSLLGLSYDACVFSEQNQLTISQIDQLIAESVTSNGGEFYLDQFFEKGESIWDRTKQLLIRAGRAIRTFFQNLWNSITNKNNDLVKLAERTEQQKAQLETMMTLTGATALETSTLKTVQQASEAADIVRDSFSSLAKKMDAMIGGGGAKPVPINPDGDSSIVVLTKSLNRSTGNPLQDKQLAMYYAMLQPSYKIDVPRIVVDLDEIMEEASKLIHIADAEDGYENLYQSAKNLHMLGHKYTTKLHQLRDKIQEACRADNRAYVEINEEFIHSKLKAAEDLNRTLNELSTISDVGPVDRSNILTNIGQRLLVSTDGQIRNTEDARNHAAMRVKNDADMKSTNKLKERIKRVSGLRSTAGTAIRRQEFINNYTMYVNAVHSTAVTMQSAVALVIKILNDHLEVRNNIIEIYRNVTNATDQILDGMEGQKPD